MVGEGEDESEGVVVVGTATRRVETYRRAVLRTTVAIVDDDAGDKRKKKEIKKD